ncbi:MAG TPA: anaerobic ribonucleoside-triphosphate reductase activating protein [Candidatus Omnitrophica bacterium]|nr:anaerobic ribonucleoside-triphosphate reductase activating protein [Candidatus Omnitrophota bacterium]
MKIGGFQKISLINYPGKISSCIFTQGCPFRCPFCHNPELVWPYLFAPPLDEEFIFNFLEKRKHQIEGVVITGGEPTIHKDLINFIEKIKNKGYFVKLDTNGTNPSMVKKLVNLRLVDYIAMDVKAPWEKYNILAGTKVNLEVICKSIEIIKNSKIDYEFRTTFVRTFLDERDILKIKKIIGEEKKHKIQEFILPREKVMV